MLGFDGSERITRSEVVRAFYRLLDSTDAQQQCLFQMILHEVKHSVKGGDEQRSAWQAALDKRLESIEQAVQLTSHQLRMVMTQADFESHDYVETSSYQSPSSPDCEGGTWLEPSAALDTGGCRSPQPQIVHFRDEDLLQQPANAFREVDELHMEFRESFASARRAVELHCVDTFNGSNYGPCPRKDQVDRPRKPYRSDPSSFADSPPPRSDTANSDGSAFAYFDNIFEDVFDIVVIFDEEVEQLGLEILWHGELPMVGSVKPGGEAALRGIHSGDLLFDLNGQQAAGKSRKKILRFLQQRPLRLAVLRES